MLGYQFRFRHPPCTSIKAGSLVFCEKGSVLLQGKLFLIHCSQESQAHLMVLYVVETLYVFCWIVKHCLFMVTDWFSIYKPIIDKCSHCHAVQLELSGGATIPMEEILQLNWCDNLLLYSRASCVIASYPRGYLCQRCHETVEQNHDYLN